jgi:[ribosomal protein S5]-alanine N-acetyltransferase
MPVELRTRRLWLRPVEPADRAALHRLWTDPDVRRFLWDDRVISPAEVGGVIAASAATFAAEGFGHFALREDEAGPLLGTCGLHRYAPGAEPELLYSLARAQWGRGLATEAARAVADDAFGRLGFARVIARADVPNRDSQRVMQRLGMAYAGEEEAGGLRLVRYVLGRSS